MILKREHVCPFNKEVDCQMDPEKDICAKCGWNPDENARRIEKTRALRMNALTEKMKGERK